MRLNPSPCFAVAACLCLLLAGPAMAMTTPVVAAEFGDDTTAVRYRRATFVLASGDTIRDVPFVVDERFGIIALEIPGAGRKVSFGDIDAVYDGAEDITRVIVGRPAQGVVVLPPVPKTEQAGEELLEPAVDTGPAPAPAAEAPAPPPAGNWLSGKDPVYVKRSAPLWKLGLRVAGHYSNPVGDYYEGIGAGFGFEGDVLIGLKRTIGLRLSVARSGLGTDDLSLASYPPLEPVTSQEWNMAVWRFTVAAQVQKPLTERKGELGMLYLYTGIGAIWQELSVDFVVGGTPRHVDYDETKLLMTLGGGVVKMVTRTVGIDLAGEMGLVYVGSDPNQSYSYYGNTQTALLLDLKLGVVKLFN